MGVNLFPTYVALLSALGHRYRSNTLATPSFKNAKFGIEALPCREGIDGGCPRAPSHLPHDSAAAKGDENIGTFPTPALHRALRSLAKARTWPYPLRL